WDQVFRTNAYLQYENAINLAYSMKQKKSSSHAAADVSTNVPEEGGKIAEAKDAKNEADQTSFLLQKLRVEVMKIAQEESKMALASWMGRVQCDNSKSQAFLAAEENLRKLILLGASGYKNFKGAYRELVNFSPSWGFWGKVDIEPFLGAFR